MMTCSGGWCARSSPPFADPRNVLLWDDDGETLLGPDAILECMFVEPAGAPVVADDSVRYKATSSGVRDPLITLQAK